MARVFLINPPAPEPVRAPLLSMCYLASALRAGGHEVALLDAAAPFGPSDPDAIAGLVASFGPDLVGVHLKTQQVQPAYRLAARLAGRHRLVAGGPHATACPEEPPTQGFDLVVRGEGEQSLVELADAVDGRRPINRVPGTSGRSSAGAAWTCPKRAPLDDLDQLASPLSALDLFDPAWYGATRAVSPAGLLASRGCPAACSFCCNVVTGRRFRARRPQAVAAEVRALRDCFGASGFTFFDDSFAVGTRRVRELCGALAELGEPLAWSCTAHPAHLDREMLVAMHEAGCRGLDVGLESGDAGVLARIGKGTTVARVLEVLAWCRELGIRAVVNLMVGWPDETDAELSATAEFLERVAPIAGGVNARGVLVPYPGTRVYEENHERFGFTKWWLTEPPLVPCPFPTTWDEPQVLGALAYDPALARNFFRHPKGRLERMAEILARKAELSLRAASQA